MAGKSIVSLPILNADSSPCPSCGGNGNSPPSGEFHGIAAPSPPVPAAGRRRISWGGWALALILLLGGAVHAAGSWGGFLQETLRNLAFMGAASWKLMPYFLVSVLASAWATTSGMSERIRGVFARREGIAVAGAAAVGAVIPICSCSVIPFIAALLAGGVPLGPVMAFWISSPLMSPETFLLTAGALGSDFAVARLVVAVLLGAGAGYLASALSARGLLADQLKGAARPEPSCCGAPAPPCGCGATDMKGAEAGATVRSRKSFWIEAGKTAAFLGKWLLIAFFLEALIIHYVDPAWVSALLGGDRPLAVPLATAVGIPLYTSGVGAIPIVQGLLASGMSPGAALAFLVAGPVTTIPAMVAVGALVQRRTFLLYLGSGVLGSLAAGYLFQLIAG